MKLSVYDIDYHGLGLHVLESFDEGEFVFASKIKFIRKYVSDPRDPTMYTHYTQIFDCTIPDYRGQIGIFHGFAQC